MTKYITLFCSYVLMLVFGVLLSNTFLQDSDLDRRHMESVGRLVEGVDRLNRSVDQYRVVAYHAAEQFGVSVNFEDTGGPAIPSGTSSRELSAVLQDLSQIEKTLYPLLNDIHKKSQIMETLSRVEPSIVSGFPVDRGWISSPYGKRVDPFVKKYRMHNGVDIAASPGSDVYATGPGRIAASGRAKGYGKRVLIEHPHGITTVSAHLSEILVDEGEVVEKGDIIGRVGSTGRSTGPHIHYEVLAKGEHTNPIDYLTR